MCSNSILKQQDLASLTACMGRLQLIKPYSKQSIRTQHNILSLIDRIQLPYQITLIYFSTNVLTLERSFCLGLGASAAEQHSWFVCILCTELTRSKSIIKKVFVKIQTELKQECFSPSPINIRIHFHMRTANCDIILFTANDLIYLSNF